MDDMQELNLEDILKEFGGSVEPGPDEQATGIPEFAQEEFSEEQLVQSPNTAAQPEKAKPEPADDVPDETDEANETEENVPAEAETSEASADGPEPDGTSAVTADTVRLDSLDDVQGTKENWADAERIDDASEDAPNGPITFRPKASLRELKRQLIAGPEKRYYELSEIGVGKLHLSVVLCLVIVALSGAAAAAFSAGAIPPERQKLMVYAQILAMLLGALLGCYEMLDGIGDLFHGKFTVKTFLTVTFVAGCADAMLCIRDLRMPICAAFTLEVAMSLLATAQRRSTEMGQMDTLRKASRLGGVVQKDDFYEGRPGFLRTDGRLSDFMDHYNETTGAERAQNIYAFAALLLSVGAAAVAALLHSLSLGVQVLSTTLFATVPASFFIATSHPSAVLERRLHSIGTVLCGGKGVKGLRRKSVYALRDTDIFPAGETRMNGVKFYGDRDPELTIAYAAALMRACGGILAPIFDQLLTARSGARYPAENMQYYGNGGIGGEICGEPVLMGTLEFLKNMGVEIPDGIMVKQAVYISIDGELSGLFAVTYTRTKFAAAGLASLGGNRRVHPVLVAQDFMLTDAFLKEKFGFASRRMDFPDRATREALSAQTPPDDASCLALTTQEGLAPAAYAISGARALHAAWGLGIAVHIIGGVLGALIMLALAYLGQAELLTPVHVLLYQLVWMIPGWLASLWVRTM